MKFCAVYSMTLVLGSIPIKTQSKFYNILPSNTSNGTKQLAPKMTDYYHVRKIHKEHKVLCLYMGM